MDLIRKAFWPAALVIDFLVFLAAIGSGTGTAHADFETDGGVFLEQYGIDDSTDCTDGILRKVFAFADDGGKNWKKITETHGDDESEGPSGSNDDEDDVIQLRVGDELIMCVEPHDVDANIVTFDADDAGEWTDAACGNGGDSVEFPDDACLEVSGDGTDRLIVFEEIVFDENESSGPDDDFRAIAVTFTCADDPGIANITISQSDAGTSTTTPIHAVPDKIEFVIMCKDEPKTVDVSVKPKTLEIVPAIGNSAHALVDVTITDSSGGPVMPNTEVQFSVSQCLIEENAVDGEDELDDAKAIVKELPGRFHQWHAYANDSEPSSTTEIFTPGGDEGVIEEDHDSDDHPDIPDHSHAAAIIHADIGGSGHTSGKCVPGTVTLTIIVEVRGGKDIIETEELTIVGPPAAITVAASPTSLRCGEKSTIIATIVESIGQNVSDHTLVEAVTNAGGVLGGTLAVAALAGPVVPISSTVAGTFDGTATMFLITSEQHSGPYEVIVTTGGTAPNVYPAFSFDGDDNIDTTLFGDLRGRGGGALLLGGLFSTALISAQVTVECSIPPPAPDIVAPATGQGITPPSTGDAGLVAGSSGSSWILVALGGLAAFAFAGFATLRFARR